MEQLNNIVHIRDYFDEEDSEKVRTLIKNILNKHTEVTKTHSLRVARYVHVLGKYMGLGTNKIKLLEIAALLHDIGKLNIPQGVLEKPGKLTGEEWRVMINHAIDGPWIVKLTNSYKTLSEKGRKTMDHYILNSVGDHHLCYGGGGYGASSTYGNDISFFARILCVIDSFDAMTSERPYCKRKKTFFQASEELRRNSNTQFDPMIVDKFIRALHFGGSRLSPLN